MINISKLYCGLSGQSDKLRYSPDNRFGPIVVYNCTSRCNLACRHCYSSSRSCQQDKELSTQQAKDMLKDIADFNCPVVLFSGGEPLLREDLFELIEEANNLNLRTVLSTNGTLMNLQTAKKLADLAVNYVGISIDGPEDFNNQFRGTKNCFSMTMQGIKNCIDVGIKTGLRFTIIRENYQHVPYIFKLAKNLGVRRICFYHLIRTGRAQALKDNQLTNAQIRNTINTIIDKTKEHVDQGLLDEVLTVGNHADGPYLLLRMSRENHPDFDIAKRLLKNNQGNRVGEKIACVGWAGEVYADQFWRNYSLGNITEKPFSEIWSDENDPVLNMLRNKDKFKDDKCANCKWFNYCKGNYRCLESKLTLKNWLLEPPCYLKDDEIQ